MIGSDSAPGAFSRVGRNRCLPAFFVCVKFLVASVGAAEVQRPNVLFIAVDDLRPQIGCFGHPAMNTPNLDRLAERGVRFERAYCNVPTCGASRASLMTGIRPARNRFVSPTSYAEKEASGVTTLNTHFKSHGYHTVSLGKVFHHADDYDEGWSGNPGGQNRVLMPNARIPRSPRRWRRTSIG